METTVVNVKTESADVYCGRPSIWGNPHVIGSGLSRTEAIARYKKTFYDMMKDEFYIQEIEKLRGKKIGCWCKPKPCHLDVISEYLNSNQLEFE